MIEREEVINHRVFLVALANDVDTIQLPLRGCFSHEMEMQSFNEAQRIQLLSESLQGISDPQKVYFFIILLIFIILQLWYPHVIFVDF